MNKIIGIKGYGIIKVNTIEAVEEIEKVLGSYCFTLICSNVKLKIRRDTREEAKKSRDFIIINMSDQLGSTPLFKDQFSGLKDKNNEPIRVGDKVEGFNRKFIVKKGVKEIEKVSPGGEINLVMIPCIYFECIETGDTLFPIVKNKDGISDLEGLEVVREWSK